jgi:hypothetical protein
MAKVTSSFTPIINLDNIADPPIESHEGDFAKLDSDKKLDRLLELQEQVGEGFSLARAEFKLKQKQTNQNMAIQKIEFRWMLRAKIVLFIFVIALVSAIAYKLYCLFGKASISDLMLFDKTHVILAIVVGCFLTMFGLLTVLLKGLGQKDKADTPIAIEEVLKSILSAFKSNK